MMNSMAVQNRDIAAVLDRALTVGAIDDLGARRKVVDQISPESGAYLGQLVRDLDARQTVEVGLAYGISALYILDALGVAQDRCHIIIDPYQSTGYNNAGLRLLAAAGCQDRIEFREDDSCVALAELVKAKRTVDLALIDGWTTFDAKLTDVRLADKLLRVDGILVVRTGGTSSGLKLTRYLETNWQWYSRLGSTVYYGEEDIVAYRKDGTDARHWKFHKDF